MGKCLETLRKNHFVSKFFTLKQFLMNGFYLIDKEQQWTSFDVCAKMRSILKTKKVGHTGTLDPFATGLLIIATGKCTRLIPFFERAKKTYITKIVFGKKSESHDIDSEVKTVNIPDSEKFSYEKCEEVLKKHFLGKIEQVPPRFSAIKINGKRACDRMRNGEEVKLKSRGTEVFRVEILNFNFPCVEFELEVAAGFYVRSFARDLAKIFGTSAVCESLRRTKINKISVDDAQKISEVKKLIEPKFLISNIPHCEIEINRKQDFVAGRAFPFLGVEKEKMLVLCEGQTIGVGEIVCEKLQPKIVMN
jgi:tRNA pseudouridine55 synthase